MKTVKDADAAPNDSKAKEIELKVGLEKLKLEKLKLKNEVKNKESHSHYTYGEGYGKNKYFSNRQWQMVQRRFRKTRLPRFSSAKPLYRKKVEFRQ